MKSQIDMSFIKHCNEFDNADMEMNFQAGQCKKYLENVQSDEKALERIKKSLLYNKGKFYKAQEAHREATRQVNILLPGITEAKSKKSAYQKLQVLVNDFSHNETVLKNWKEATA